MNPQSAIQSTVRGNDVSLSLAGEGRGEGARTLDRCSNFPVHREGARTSNNRSNLQVHSDVPPAAILFLLAFLTFLFPTATPSRASDYDAQFNKWFEVQTNLQSWSGDFTQTRTLTVLNQPLISTGKVWVKPGEFRWELGNPVSTIVLRRPDELLIEYPRLKRAEKYALGTVPSGPMRDALALMDASLPRDRASMEEHFKLVSAALTNSILQITLQPRSEAARKMIGQVIIGFHTNDYIIATTQMKFADGSSLQNTFTNIVINQPPPPELFEEKLPSDYTVVEPLKQ